MAGGIARRGRSYALFEDSAHLALAKGPERYLSVVDGGSRMLSAQALTATRIRRERAIVQTCPTCAISRPGDPQADSCYC